jgi:hypothetical protein
MPVRLELADIFRCHGDAWRTANAGHISVAQQRVMKAIESCRTAVLGGHVERCEDCTQTRIAYNSCRNRHCPKCQGSAAAAWLAARQTELLPVPYFHVVFTLPTVIGAMAYQNKSKLYGLLFKAASEALITVARDPKRLGAEIGITAVLHTWGQNLQHHPHLHCIISGGGISRDGKRWVSCKSSFLPPRILARFFRRLFLNGLIASYEAGELQFFGNLVELNDAHAFSQELKSLHASRWGVCSKEHYAGPQQVLAYLARYTHRVAIVNSRLLDLDETHVSFAWRKYQANGSQESNVIRLEIAEFLRRFLLHVLPSGFRRVRHYGLLANGHRAAKLVLCRSLLDASEQTISSGSKAGNPQPQLSFDRPTCPCCGGRMLIVEILSRTPSRTHHVRRLDAS